MTLGRARGVLSSPRRATRIRRIPTRRFLKPEHSRALPGFWGPRRADTSEVSSYTTLTAGEEDQIITSVTHFPKPSSGLEGGSRAELERGGLVGTERYTYTRMIAFENKGKRIEIIDPKVHALDASQTYISESSLQAMSKLGQGLLNQSDSGIPSASQIGTDTTSQTLLPETIIGKFKKMLLTKE
ncbi:unnamed protein product [Rhizoctonia solani]|uniref:Uncharacterized protein n=1 Tax=Rhizoctonia solani TaxID=456999 RepID=A0A8H2ZWT7_9AGAM|nr:unnamed protein product [Rhizoctonia solani]